MDWRVVLIITISVVVVVIVIALIIGAITGVHVFQRDKSKYDNPTHLYLVLFLTLWPQRYPRYPPSPGGVELLLAREGKHSTPEYNI